jgi:hypothetical protein
MRKLFLSLALGLLFAFGVNAQNAKGNWYVGTGDVAHVAWTDWAVSPTIGYAITDAIVLGGSLSQVSGEVQVVNIYARYFFSNCFADVNLNGSKGETPSMVLGLGKMFTFHKVAYIAPTLNYDYDAETLNLGLGFGFKF